MTKTETCGWPSCGEPGVVEATGAITARVDFWPGPGPAPFGTGEFPAGKLCERHADEMGKYYSRLVYPDGRVVERRPEDLGKDL